MSPEQVTGMTGLTSLPQSKILNKQILLDAVVDIQQQTAGNGSSF